MSCVEGQKVKVAAGGPKEERTFKDKRAELERKRGFILGGYFGREGKPREFQKRQRRGV